MKRVKEIEVKLFSFKLKSLYFFMMIFAVVAFSLCIRLINLTKLPIFADEAIYIRWAQVMRAEPSLRFLPLTDGKQPLFMWTVIPFLKIFSDPLFAGRLLSVISGTGTLIGVVFVSKLFFRSEKLAVLSAIFYALSPFSFFFERMALVDSLLSMFGVWSLFFFAKAVKTLRFDYAMFAGFALGGAFLTKSPAIFSALLLPSALLLTNVPKKRGGFVKFAAKLAMIAVLTYGIAFAMFNIMRLGSNFHMLSSRNLDYVHSYSHILKSPLDPFLPHLTDVVDWFCDLGPFVIVPFLVGAVVWAIKKKSREAFVISLFAFLPILVQMEYAKVFTARYIFFTIPFIYILSPLAFRIRGFLMRFFFVVLFVGFITWSLWQNFWFIKNPERASLPPNERSGYLEEWTAGTGIKEVSEYIIKYHKEKPEEKIVVGTEGYFGTLPDGLQIYLNNYPEITVIGTGLDFKEVPQSLIDSASSGNKTFFVVNDSRLKEDFSKLNLIPEKSFKKAGKKDGNREEMILFLF